MRRKITVVALCVALAACAFAGVAINEGGGDQELITVTDMVGDEVKVPKDPKKVACVSRTTYDLLIAFGVGDIIDGAYYSVLDNEWTEIIYPDSKNHYRYEYEESYETFYSRGVDLILSPEKYIAEDLRNHGLTAITVSLYGEPSFDGYVFYMADLVETLWGDREGVSEKVSAWKESFDEARDRISSELDKHDDLGNTLYYVRGDKRSKGLGYTDNGPSFTEYVYRFFRFEPISVSFHTATPSVEAICEIDPDVIVIGGQYQNSLTDTLYSEQPWKNLTAVKTGRVYGIPVGLTIFEQISAMSSVYLYDQANKLYPEYFDFDVESMVKDAYKSYLGTELTDGQVYNILHGLDAEGRPAS